MYLLRKQTTYFYRTLPIVFQSTALWMMLECAYLCTHTQQQMAFTGSCCTDTYSPFFTFFEDFSYFIKRNFILVRYLEEKKAMIGEARRLLSLSFTSYFTERNNNKKSSNDETALPYKGNINPKLQRKSTDQNTFPAFS